MGNPVLGLKESLPADKYPPLYQYPRMPQYRATMIQRLKEAGHDSLDVCPFFLYIPACRPIVRIMPLNLMGLWSDPGASS